jgi:3-hydroxyacyl-CoA dehydrogenase
MQFYTLTFLAASCLAAPVPNPLIGKVAAVGAGVVGVGIAAKYAPGVASRIFTEGGVVEMTTAKLAAEETATTAANPGMLSQVYKAVGYTGSKTSALTEEQLEKLIEAATLKKAAIVAAKKEVIPAV